MNLQAIHQSAKFAPNNDLRKERESNPFCSWRTLILCIYSNNKAQNQTHDNSSKNFCKLAGKNTLTPLDIAEWEPTGSAFALTLCPAVVRNLEMEADII